MEMNKENTLTEENKFLKELINSLDDVKKGRIKDIPDE